MPLNYRVLIPPYTPVGGVRNYTCHGAVVYWAAKELGLSDSRAYALYDRIAGYYNAQGGCVDPTSSIIFSRYGEAFCKGAQQLTTPNIQAAEYTVGDVVIAEMPNAPMHSMIVVGVNVAQNTVNVRGFNNFLTFGNDQPPPPHNYYDTSLRNLGTRAFPNTPLFRISQATFCQRVSSAALKLGFRI